MHLSFVQLAVWAVLLSQQIIEGSGTVVRRRRVRKQKIPQEIPRRGRKLDLNDIDINQDFNTEFVKAALYGDSEKSVKKEENIRPIFATRKGDSQIHTERKNLDMRNDVVSLATDKDDARIGRLLDFPFNSVQNKDHELHKNPIVRYGEDYFPTIESEHSINTDNVIEMSNKDDLYAIDKNDAHTIKADMINGAQEFNKFDYEEREARFDNHDLNKEERTSDFLFHQSAKNYAEVFDGSHNIEKGRNFHNYESPNEEDIYVTPLNHNGNLPYHLEGTIGRHSKQTSEDVLNRGDLTMNTADVNFAFQQLKFRNERQELQKDLSHPHHSEVDQTNLRIRGPLKNEDPHDGIIRFNGKETLSSYHRKSQERSDETRNINREPRQGTGDNTAAIFDEVASASPDRAGQRCINKVVLETETQYDDIVECKHSYDKRCHTTFSTDYEPTQEEKCTENFRKNCFIEYSTTAYNETVQICRQPLLKDCNLSGPEICRTEYESECWTRNEEHDVTDDVVECTEVKEQKCEDETSGYTTQQKCSYWPVQKCEVRSKQVKKFSPKTKCTKVPKELCAPAGCGFTPGLEECYDKVQTVLGQHPEENCSLEPQTTCKHITKLVPKLVAREECLDVPKEVCTRSKENPRRIQKPVIKKWCYTPSEETGLA